MFTGGMVGPPLPTCPNGHGPMSQIPGEWALSQITRKTTGLGGEQGFPTGNLYGAQLWCCLSCGLLHLYDPTIRGVN
jgi:hypothetical protein